MTTTVVATVQATSCAGLTRSSTLFARRFILQGWITGSRRFAAAR
jgi:hypothetical protein